jgi:CRISPR/Cas system-associated protein Cas7 (RAMP superfamily)
VVQFAVLEMAIQAVMTSLSPYGSHTSRRVPAMVLFILILIVVIITGQGLFEWLMMKLYEFFIQKAGSLW